MQLSNDDLAHIKTYLVQPIADKFDDFRDSMQEVMKEVRATLRAVSDPATGYIPRSEMQMELQSVWKGIDSAKDRAEEVGAQVQGAQLGTVKWVIATALSSAGLAVAALELSKNVFGGK